MSTNVILYKIKGNQTLPVYQIMILALVIFLISYFGALGIEKQINKKKEEKSAEK